MCKYNIYTRAGDYLGIWADSGFAAKRIVFAICNARVPMDEMTVVAA